MGPSEKRQEEYPRVRSCVRVGNAWNTPSNSVVNDVDHIADCSEPQDFSRCIGIPSRLGWGVSQTEKDSSVLPYVITKRTEERIEAPGNSRECYIVT